MRKIAFLTGSRGEWGYIRPIIKEIENRPDMNYQIIATHMQLLPEFGMAVNEIERDGFRVDEKLYMTLDGYNSVTMTKSLAILLLELPTVLKKLQPDILLLAGDRGEQLMGAIAAGHLGIPVAHVQSGELSGNIDGIVRHAITKLAHIHFAANEEFANRVKKLGEQHFRVFTTGAPQLDEIASGMYTPAEQLYRMLKVKPGENLILAVQHPVTEEEGQSGMQILETIEAIASTQWPAVMIYPNADAGSEAIRKSLNKLKGTRIQLHRNLPRADFLGLMRIAKVMVGNSSSGLLEAPTFKLPCVNIGRRQHGRPQAKNVINTTHNKDEILAAIQKASSSGFREQLLEMKNPYGDGLSAIKIVNILAEIGIDANLLNKEMTY